MKKILLAALLLMVCISSVSAVPQTCQTYIITNNANSRLVTYVSTSTIIPGIHKIVSISAYPCSGCGHGSVAAIYDAASAAQLTEANMRGEAEANINLADQEVFPYPKSLANGVAVIQTPYSIAKIEYTR